MRKKKILIVGNARHGKDTVAEILNEWFDFEYLSSSEGAARIFIYDLLKEKYGYKSFEECFKDRHNHRAEWYDLITEYNKEDRVRLARRIIEDNDCYVGMRNPDELEAARDLFDLIIYVDASERLPLEDISSNGITKGMADIIIDNNSTLEELKRKVVALGMNLYYVRENKYHQYLFGKIKKQ